jgi:hypothetical protein
MQDSERDTSEAKKPVSDDIPRLQRLFDRPFLLLLLGMLVMVVFYTAWGLYEITTLPESTLP